MTLPVPKRRLTHGSMKSSSLCRASLSGTDFQLSQLPYKNKALADENAALLAKVAQLQDEKEKWQIKYCSLNMKVSDYIKYREDVKKLLQSMSFYLQNFLVVRDMIDRMSQQESDYVEMEHHNTKPKQRAEPEQVSNYQNNPLMREEEQQQKQQQQQQQQRMPQHQLQNTPISPILQLLVDDQPQKCMSENEGEHHLHHQKDKTGVQSKEIQHYQLINDHLSQEDEACPVSEQQLLIKDQRGSVSDQFYQENDCKAHKQRTVHIKEVEQQIVEQQKPEDENRQPLESNNETQYCEGVQQQHAGLWGKPQTKYEYFNTGIQRAKFFRAQRPSFTDIQGQVTTDKARQLGEHVRGAEQQKHTLEQREQLVVNNERYLNTPVSPKSVTINELQFTHGLDHPFTSDREQLFSVESRQQVNIHKALQPVEEEEEEEKRKSVKSGEYLPSANDKLHSMKRDQGVNTRNGEISVGIRQQLVKLRHMLPATLYASLSIGKGQKFYQHKGKQQSSESGLQISPELKELPRQKDIASEEQHIVKQLSEKQRQEHNIKGQQFISVEVQQQKICPPPFVSMKDLQQPSVEQNQQLITVHGRHLRHYQLNREAIQDSAVEKESCLTPVQIQQIALEKELSHCTEQLAQLTIKRDQSFTSHQEHQLRNGKEQGNTDSQGSTDQQHQFVTGQQERSICKKLQHDVGNKNQKLTNRQVSQGASDTEMKLKAKKRKQFDKEEGLVPNSEQTRQFTGEHTQQITIKKRPQLVPRNEQGLSYGQPIVEQGQQLITEQVQKQQTVKQDQQLEGEKGHNRKGEQTQQTTVKKIKGSAANNCWSAPADCQQRAVERADQRLVEGGQQQFTKQTLELSAELSQEILVQKFQDTVAKEVKWLPPDQYQWLLTKKEWKLKGLQGQSTPPHCEEELQEHSSVFLLPELNKTGFETTFNSSTHSILHRAKKIQQTSIVNSTGFETSFNSSTESILRCAKRIQQISTMNSTGLHRSYMEDSIIKRIPVIAETPIYKTLDQYKLPTFLQVSHQMSPDKLFNRNGRPRRKCAIGVNYFISP